MKAANVRPITDLKNHAKELVKEVSENGQSVLITQNGKPTVVLMDAKQHDRLQETLAMLKILAQSQQQLAKTGRRYSTADVRQRLKSEVKKARKGS